MVMAALAEPAPVGRVMLIHTPLSQLSLGERPMVGHGRQMRALGVATMRGALGIDALADRIAL